MTLAPCLPPCLVIADIMALWDCGYLLCGEQFMFIVYATYPAYHHLYPWIHVVSRCDYWIFEHSLELCWQVFPPHRFSPLFVRTIHKLPDGRVWWCLEEASFHGNKQSNIYGAQWLREYTRFAYNCALRILKKHYKFKYLCKVQTCLFVVFSKTSLISIDK